MTEGQTTLEDWLRSEAVVSIITAQVERFESEIAEALLSAHPHERLGTIDRSIGVRRGLERLAANCPAHLRALGDEN